MLQLKDHCTQRPGAQYPVRGRAGSRSDQDVIAVFAQEPPCELGAVAPQVHALLVGVEAKQTGPHALQVRRLGPRVQRLVVPQQLLLARVLLKVVLEPLRMQHTHAHMHTIIRQ